MVRGSFEGGFWRVPGGSEAVGDTTVFPLFWCRGGGGLRGSHENSPSLESCILSFSQSVIQPVSQSVGHHDLRLLQELLNVLDSPLEARTPQKPGGPSLPSAASDPRGCSEDKNMRHPNSLIWTNSQGAAAFGQLCTWFWVDQIHARF